MRIRAMLLSDMDEIRKLECNIFSDAWSENNLKESIVSEMDYCFIVENDYRIMSYIIFRINGDEAELFRIATDEKERNKGFGWKLMDIMMSNLTKRGIKRVFLEVRGKNRAAIRLYEGFGFKKIGARKGYYNDPVEDAIIMSAALE